MSQLTSLYLAPNDPDSAPAVHSVRHVLADLEIIADGLGPASYAAGGGFSRHVIYAGCSPYLLMQPPQDGRLNFCHVVLHGPYGRAKLVTGPNTVKPRCPVCRTRFEDWKDRLADWQSGSGAAHCGGCGHDCRASQLDWRGHAISGRVLVELRNVFPGEASPSDPLMHSLKMRTGEDWHYAWAAYLDDSEVPS
jgi:hypothetical protein